MPYLLDTNVFLQAKNLHDGFDFCPGFWDWLQESTAAELFFSIEKVKAELVDDDAAAWALKYTVVTHEVPANSVRKVKIPNVCIGLDVRCMTPFEMLRVERARFILERRT